MANDCSLRNAQEKDKCMAFYANYRACMEFWVSSLNLLLWLSNDETDFCRLILNLREEDREFVHYFLLLKKEKKFYVSTKPTTDFCKRTSA